jgi:holo-[acyl-carrier protein] synthase
MLGIDIVENKRIEESLNRFGERFLKKIYTEREIEYCRSYKDFIPCLAARWAAKEAVIKAFFQTFGKVLKFKQIEVLGKKGYPAQVNLLGEEKKLLELHSKEIIISIAHERKFSVAVAQIVEKTKT